jgi:hypothetical protein
LDVVQHQPNHLGDWKTINAQHPLFPKKNIKNFFSKFRMDKNAQKS